MGCKSKKPCSEGVVFRKKPNNIQDPSNYYNLHPSWNFRASDKDKWAFTSENIGDSIWTEILPKLSDFESQKWSDILVRAKKQNHSISVKNLNKRAQDRLDELKVEQESVVSLRLSGNHRIYGYIVNAVFYVLWYDDDHGDNNTCVCRSRKK